MIPSADLMEFLQGWEAGPGGGPALSCYDDGEGTLTIGFGHTGADVIPGITITTDDACDLLRGDVDRIASPVSALIHVPISQAKYDALVSFAFNLGLSALRSSTLLKFVNTAQYIAAAAEFPRWDHAGGKEVAGLLKRRVAEMHIFTDADYSARP